MSWISRIVRALRPSRAALDLADELQFHLDERTEELVRRGTSRAEAQRLAGRQFGSPLRHRDSSRDVKSVVWLESWLRDLRFGLRMIAKDWKVSLAAIASLALAIGACTTTFALMDALIFRPLPVPAPHQLVDVARLMPSFFSPQNQPQESTSFSYAQYQALSNAANGRAELFAIITGVSLRLSEDSHGVGGSVRSEVVSGNAFRVLGLRPALGRLIEPEDDFPGNANTVAVISYGFWKRRFGGSPAAIGERLRIGTESFQIVGVAAPSFGGIQPGYLVDVWIPLSVPADSRMLNDPDAGFLRVWGRVRPDANRLQLRERLQAVITNFLRERVHINPPRNLHGPQIEQFVNAPLRLRDASSGADSIFRLEFRRPIWILSLICGLLLLLACSNVANLMLARASSRNAEMALRISLGAGRSRLVRQMLIESGQIALGACILAVGFAALAAPAMVARLGSPEVPAWLDVAPDAAALAFAVGVSLFTGLLFGIVPALRVSAVSPDAALRSGGMQHSSRMGSLRWMLAAEIGLSVTVLFLSGLLLQSFRKLIAVDLGFDARNVILFELIPEQRENPGTPVAGLLDVVRHLPGVKAASLSIQRPMGGDMVWIQTPIIRFPGRSKEVVRPREVPVSAGFFESMQIRWIAGRDFRPDEGAGDSSPVIVNQAFADTFFHGQNPIGLRFEKLGDDPDPVRQEVIGVVGNARWNNLREPAEPSIYTPIHEIGIATLSIRTSSQAAPLIRGLRKQILAAAPGLSVRTSILLQDQIDNTLTRERLLAILAGFFSVVALLLAAVGLYGVINYAALRRTREIGIRIALGARPEAVVGLVLSDASVSVLLGIGAGIGSGLGLGRYLASQLFAVKATDFWSLTVPITCIVAVGFAAVLPPALRAASTDPLIALKHE
ncbi:MAG TPA: ADOP family duplicated permease [Bryobacteraceae bacterium]|nr:ADOP family duplicated permease [Bryobacteraceae bacterium]